MLPKARSVVSLGAFLLFALPATPAAAQLRFIDRAHPGSADSIKAQRDSIKQSLARGMLPSMGSKPKKRGPPADPSMLVLPHWTGSFRIEGVDYPYTVIGTHPSAGQSTVIPTVIVPYRFTFADGGVIDAAADVIDGMTQIDGMLASPIFSDYPFMAGNTALGNTQFGDAYMRGNFWSLHGGAGSGYHVRLQAAFVLPTVEIDVPAGLGFSVILGNGETIGVIDADTMLDIAKSVMAAFGVPPSYLTMHATGRLVTTGSVSFTGIHDWVDLGVYTGGTPGPVNTYLTASWFSSAFRGSNAEVLAHEVVEWLMDPVLRNVVPAWNDPVTPSLCANPLLEVADPLEHLPPQPVVLGANSFSLPDVAFLPWFTRDKRTDTVNGWYSLRNTLTTFTQKCPFYSYLQTFYFPNDVGMTEAHLTSFNDRKQATGYFVQFGQLVSFMLGNLDPFGPGPITLDAISVPGSLATYAIKINDSAQIVGAYFDAQGREHGFLLSNGQYTTIDFPGAVATEALALDSKNNLTIAGDYLDASGVVHGFTLTAGVYKRVDVPNAQGTAITGINDSNKIVGRYQSGANVRGFTGTLGTTTSLDFVNDPQRVTLPGGINNAGTVGGTYVEGGALNGFLFGAGVFVPGAISEINDINDQGFVAGTLFVGGAPVAAFGIPVDPHSLAPPGTADAIALPAGALRPRVGGTLLRCCARPDQ